MAEFAGAWDVGSDVGLSWRPLRLETLVRATWASVKWPTSQVFGKLRLKASGFEGL